MPRRFAYKPPPPQQTPVSVERVARVGSIVVEGYRPGGAVTLARLDVGSHATPMLAGELGQAWADRFAGDARPNVTTVFGYKRAVVDLLEYCGRVGAPPGLSCRTLTAGLLDDWQDDVARRYPSRQRFMAGRLAGIVFGLLRRIAAIDPGAVAPEALERAGKPAAYSSSFFAEPLCEFTLSDLGRLVPAAIAGVWEAERRIAAGRVLVAEGEDPRVRGRWTFGNLVWLAAAGQLSTALVRENLPGHWRDWDDSLRQNAPKMAGQNLVGQVGRLVKSAYRHVFPHPLDLVGHFILIALDTAAWPEGVRDLRVSDITQRQGSVAVDLLKNRLPGSIEKLAADGGTTVAATKRFRDAGTVIRSLLDVTATARQRCGSDMLFVAGVVDSRWQAIRVGPIAWGNAPGSNFSAWIVSNGLDCPVERTLRKASGEVVVTLPALTTPWDPRRLRKATLSHYGQYHPEDMPAWRDNTLAVFQEHYVAGSVIFKTKIGKLARQAGTNLAEMVTERSGFTVVTPQAAAEVQAETAEAAKLLRLDRLRLHRLATGELDVDGGIAACADPHTSPFASPGELCRAAKLGLCLVCPNAILTPQHIPGLQRFDAEVIDEHRRSLDPVAFAQRWIPIRRAVRWVLGQLGAPTEECPQ
jgi:hypothetical protein